MENPPDAFAFRNRLGELYYQQILPKLELVFDEIGGNSKLIRQDHLEIDLGTISSENWEDVFVETTVRKLKEELLLAKNISPDEKVSGTRTKWIGKGQDGDLALIKNHFTIEETLNFFLKNGFLPWHASTNYDLSEELTAWLENNSASATHYFQKIIAGKNNQVLQRLIYRFDEKTLNSILGLVLEKQASELFKEVMRYKKAFKIYLTSLSVSSSEIKRIVYQPLFQPLGKNLADAYLKEFFYGIQKQLPSISLPVIKDKFKAVLRDHVRNKELSIIFSAMDKLPSEIYKEEVKTTTIEKKGNKNELKEGVYIQNAGLVILQPFLLPIFSHLGFVDGDNQFRNEEMHQKAVLFSQYLVSGATEINEEEVLLNKILCGYPIKAPLANELVLNDEERNEAHDLLIQIIGLWKMKDIPVNNTFEGLRQSFLQREGKLITQEKDWHLQVEQKSYDMVISSLPWSIGIIKTNWMEGVLWVEWT
jgi:hypothetical protein